MTNYILVFLVALSGLFGALSYHFYGDKVEAEVALVSAIDANTALEKSLNLQDLSCKIDNKVVSEYQAEKQVQQDKAQVVISKINTLPSIPSIPKKAQVTTNTVGTPNEEIDIDSKLPSDLLRMLSEGCLSNNGETCVPSR